MITTTVLKFQNLQYLPQKCIYEIPQERQKIKPVQDSNPRPPDCQPNLQPSELCGKFSIKVQIKPINKK